LIYRQQILASITQQKTSRRVSVHFAYNEIDESMIHSNAVVKICFYKS